MDRGLLTEKRLASLPKYARDYIQLLEQNYYSLGTLVADLDTAYSQSDVSWSDVEHIGHLPPKSTVTWKMGKNEIRVSRCRVTGGIRILTSNKLLMVGSSSNVASVVDMPIGWTWALKEPERWAQVAAMMEATAETQIGVWVCENCGARLSQEEADAGPALPYCCDRPSYVLKKGEQS